MSSSSFSDNSQRPILGQNCTTNLCRIRMINLWQNRIPRGENFATSGGNKSFIWQHSFRMSSRRHAKPHVRWSGGRKMRSRR